MNRIVWLPSPDANIASYDLESAATLSGAWALVVNVPHNLAGPNYDAAEGNFFYVHDGAATLYYRLTAIDSLGARSAPSTPFQALAYGSLSLAALSDLKDYLSIKTTADDAVLSRLLKAASAWFERQVGRTFARATYEETFDGSGNGSRKIVLRNYPVADVTSVEIDGEVIPKINLPSVTDGWRLVDDAVVLDGYRVTEGVANVKVTYTAGYVAVPDDVQQAVIEVAADRFQYRKRVGELSKSMGGESTSFVSFQVPYSVQTVIDAYERTGGF